MDGPRVVFLFLLIFFVLFTPDKTARRRLQSAYENLEEQRRVEFDVLANSTYGELGTTSLNLTGFRVDDNYQWSLLSSVQDLSRLSHTLAWKDVTGRLSYTELTGEVRGKFKRSTLSSNEHPFINLTAVDPIKEYVNDYFQRNVTEDEGEISIALYDAEANDDAVKEIRADLGLYTSSAPGNGWQAGLKGVHFDGGYIVLTTSSSKFNSLPALPQFALDETASKLTRNLTNSILTKTWDKKDEEETELIGMPQCEMVVWLIPKPISLPEDYIHQIEHELVNPEGAPIDEAPPMSFAVIVFSPDCGYVLEGDNLFGPKAEAFTRLAGRLLLAFVILLCLQIALLKRQMEKASTPSTRSRIAYQSVTIAGLGDGLLFMGLLGLLMLDEAGYLLVAAAAFLSCINVVFLEVKFLFDIWTVQVGDPARAEYERRRRTNPPAPAQPTDSLPLPATAPRPAGATPIIIGADGELDEVPASGRTSFAAVYSRFYLTLTCMMFLSIWAMSWPRLLRSTYVNILAFGYFSLWWPQIYRNIMRNCRKALSWEFVFGTSITRTVPVLYWYLVPGNILSVETSASTAYLLLGWMSLQIFILVVQRLLGPRLFVKDSWCPPAYDYHPLLQDDVEAGGMSIGLLASASEAKDKDDKTRKVFDCAICMNEIDVPVVSKDEPVRGMTWLERVNYRVTPCKHIFHAECLEGWMNLRLVCPVCRESLPPT